MLRKFHFKTFFRWNVCQISVKCFIIEFRSYLYFENLLYGYNVLFTGSAKIMTCLGFKPFGTRFRFATFWRIGHFG